MKRNLRPQTPDGRYFVSRGRLKRCTDPSLNPSERRGNIKALMQARRSAIQAASEDEANEARIRVKAAKEALGEAGPVWWNDGAPDETGNSPEASSYASWWAGLTEEDREAGG